RTSEGRAARPPAEDAPEAAAAAPPGAVAGDAAPCWAAKYRATSGRSAATTAGPAPLRIRVDGATRPCRIHWPRLSREAGPYSLPSGPLTQYSSAMVCPP